MVMLAAWGISLSMGYIISIHNGIYVGMSENQQDPFRVSPEMG